MPQRTSRLTFESSDSRFPCAQPTTQALVVCYYATARIGNTNFNAHHRLARRPSPVGRLYNAVSTTDAQSLFTILPTFYRLRWIGRVLVFKRRLATPRGDGPTADTAVSTAFLEAAYS